MVSVVPISSWLIALIAAVIAVARGPRPIDWRFAADRLLRHLMLVSVGLMGLWGAFFHLLFPAEAAQAIGWATSPFQSEVGSANLGIGLAGLYPSTPSRRGSPPRSLSPVFSAAQAWSTSTRSCAPAISLPEMRGRSCSPIF